MKVVPGGNRRIDKVLAEDYLAGLGDLELADVRALRAEADQEETDLSYLRRLLQGRVDIVSAEVERRAASTGSLVTQLPRILADTPRGPAHGLGRHRVVEPSNAGASRRHEERLATADVTDLADRDESSLRALLEELRAEEAEVSQRRRAVQRVFDETSAEITRRWRDGRGDVAELLGGAVTT